jgi:hypothetical protein
MRRKRAIGGRLGIIWAACGLAVGTGCTHNHYYYPTPGPVGAQAVSGPCDPAPGTTIISSARPILGEVCDDPPQGVRSAPIVSNAGGPITPAPIYSRPAGRPLRRGGLAWRGSATESLATTKVDGAYEDESTFK